MQKNKPLNPNKPVCVGFLFDDTLDSTDGVAQYVKRLGAWFSQNGHRVVYLCGETEIKEWSGGKVYSLARNVGVRFNGNRLSMPMISHSKEINKVLKAERIDVFHVQTPYSPVMSQRVIRRVYKSSGVVGTFHILPSGWVADAGTRVLRLIQWRSLKKIDYMVSVSSSAAEFAAKNLGVKSVIIPNAVDLKGFKQTKVKTPTPGKIVFLGRLVKRKGCAQLVKAFAVVASDNTEARLVIAGHGPERKHLEKLVGSLGLKDKVSFLGFIKEEEKADLLASADIACFPSFGGESFGMVLIEAMASGTGVVLAGNNPGYSSVLEAQPKLLFDPNKPWQLAERINELLSDKKLAAKLHAWQTEHVKQFDVNVVGEQILALYRQAIAKKPPNSHN